MKYLILIIACVACKPQQNTKSVYWGDGKSHGIILYAINDSQVVVVYKNKRDTVRGSEIQITGP